MLFIFNNGDEGYLLDRMEEVADNTLEEMIWILLINLYHCKATLAALLLRLMKVRLSYTSSKGVR